MAKKVKKRTVKCGKCGEEGHNARSCKEAEVVEESKEVPPPPTQKKTKINLSDEDQFNPRKRSAPTADFGAKASAAPYRCPKCNAVAILVIVRVKDHNASFKKKREIFKGEQRCEQCMNKPNPAELILKWGAKPGEVVSEETANA
jgi:hypothetical protein